MRFALSISWACLWAAAGTSWAQEAPKPLGPGPRLYRLESFDQEKGVSVLTQTVTSFETILVAKKVPVGGGKVVEVTETQQRPVVREERVTMYLKPTQFLDGEGKPMKEEDALGRLKPGQVFLMFGGQEPDPAYFKIFKKDVMLLKVSTGK